MNFALNNFLVDIDKYKTKTKNKSNIGPQQDIFNINRNSNASAVISGYITQSNGDLAQRLGEFLGNENFGIVSLSTTEPIQLNGLYSLRPGSVNQGSKGGLYDFSFSADGPFRNYHWLIDGEEIETDWDDITTSAFIAATNANEGAELADTFCTWKCVNGDWTQHGGAYLYCDNATRTRNIITVVEVGGYDYPATADIIIQAEVTPDVADVTGGLCFRCTNVGAVTHGTAYGFGFNINDDLIYFEKFTGAATTTLKSWIPTIPPLNHTATTWDYANAFTLKVVAWGNRFDLYFDDVNGDLVYLDTVFDDSYKVGWHGVYANDTTMQFDDFDLDHAKPVVAHPLVGAYDYNQIRMAVTSRLNDDVFADGLQRTIIAPDNPITFRQQINSLNDSNKLVYLPLNEKMGLTVYDQSGNDLNGTITGCKWVSEWVNGKKLIGLKMDGTSSDYISLGDQDELSFEEAAPFSIEAHIKPDLSQIYNIASKYNAGANREWKFIVTTAGHLNITLFDQGSSANYIRAQSDAGVITDSETVHVIATYNGSGSETGIEIYANGVNVTYTQDEGGVYPNMTAGTAICYLGRVHAAAEYSKGIFWNASIYHDVITATEVLAKYNKLSLNDPTGGEVKVWDTRGEDGLWDYCEFLARLNEGTGTAVYDSSKHNRAVTEASWATADWSTSSYNKWAKGTYHFDGAADYFYATLDGENVDDHAWTIGCWVNFDGTGALEGILDLYDIVDGNAMRLYKNASDLIYISIDASVTNGVWYYNTALNSGQWYFIVTTWSGNTSDIPILYINGKAVSLTTHTSLDGNVYDVDRFYVGITNGVAYMDGYIDDPFCYSIVASADRIKWLYENIPNMVIEEGYEDIIGWQRVYDPDHEFVGDMIVDNGLIRVSQGYRDRTYNMIGLNYYSDGIWNESSPVIYPSYQMGAITKIEPTVVIKSIEKYKVVLDVQQPNQTYDDIFYTEFYITQNPIVMIKIYDWTNVTGNVLAYGLFESYLLDGLMGYNKHPRFKCVTLDKVDDHEVQTASISGDETEGLSLGFSTQSKVLWLYFDEADTAWVSHWNAGYISRGFYNTGIDFDADTPPHWWGIGLMSFDTSRLQIQQNSAADDDQWDYSGGGTTVEADAVHGLGATGGGYAVNLNAQLDEASFYFSGGSYNDLPQGSYRAFVRLVDLNQLANDVHFAVYNQTDGAYMGNTTNNDITVGAAWDWYFVDFILEASDAEDSLRIFIEKELAGANEIWIDQCIIVPIANSKNFPLDFRNQALSIEHIKESCV